MEFSIVIPAHMKSTRLPNKVLVDIGGRPMLWRVWDQIRPFVSHQRLFVATDSPEIVSLVTKWGGQALLTPACRSGTERAAAVVDQLVGDFIVNVQADELNVGPLLLAELVRTGSECPEADLITPVFRITETDVLMDSSVVKVVRGHDGRALYFSRAAVPYFRDAPVDSWVDRCEYWGHIGVYGYRRDVLLSYRDLPESSLEDAERLEQLRYLEAGYRIHTFVTEHRPESINTPHDLWRVRGAIHTTQRDTQ